MDGREIRGGDRAQREAPAAGGGPVPGESWNRDGRSVTVRLVSGGAVLVVDDGGWQRSMTVDELRRRWTRLASRLG